MAPYYYGVYRGYGGQGYGGRGQSDLKLKFLRIEEVFFKVAVVVDVVEVVFDHEEELIKRINLRITVNRKKLEVKFSIFL
jgi:hypothetical protein